MFTFRFDYFNLKGPRRNCFWSGCDGKSISFKNLSRHIRTHTGVKLYVCKVLTSENFLAKL